MVSVLLYIVEMIFHFILDNQKHDKFRFVLRIFNSFIDGVAIFVLTALLVIAYLILMRQMRKKHN